MRPLAPCLPPPGCWATQPSHHPGRWAQPAVPHPQRTPGDHQGPSSSRPQGLVASEPCAGERAHCEWATPHRQHPPRSQTPVTALLTTSCPALPHRGFHQRSNKSRLCASTASKGASENSFCASALLALVTSGTQGSALPPGTNPTGKGHRRSSYSNATSPTQAPQTHFTIHSY